MTVSASPAYSGPYTPNNSTVAFPFTFPCQQASDVAVIIGSADVTTGFVVTLNADQLANPGGNATFTTAPLTGAGSIYVYSDPDFGQNAAFEAGVPWITQSVITQNGANDRSAIRDQVLARDVGRAPLVPIGQSAPVLNLSGAVDGQVLGLAGGVVVPVTGPSGVTVSNPLLTRTAIVAQSPAAAVATLQTSGFTTAKDGGGAQYNRATGPFTDGSSFQTADGAWWQYATGQDIKAAHFGVVADGFSFTGAAISAGALSQVVLSAAAWKTSAATVGNPITIIGGAGGGYSLITTIAAVSGNTITLAAPVSAAMTNVCGNFGTDNTAAINRVIAYATTLVSASYAKTLQGTDVQVLWPFGLTCFTGVITIPDYVSIRGWGSRGTQWLAMSSNAQLHLTTSSYTNAGGSYGQNFYGWSVHGNNITTSSTGLVHADTVVGASFNDFRVWYSLSDGLYMDNAQNCQFNNCTFAANGNPIASFYTFPVSGVIIAPTAGTVYTSNGQTFYVLSSAITAGTGTIICVGTGSPTGIGTLINNNGGTGDAAIIYTPESGGGPTGANVRFTNGASGSIFIRCEMPNTANWGVVIEGDCAQNVLLLGESEFFKGQFANEYYPTAFPNNPTIASLLCDGGAGATPYQYQNNICEFHESSYYGDSQGRVIPHMILRNGGTHIIDTVAYAGDGAGGIKNTVFCQIGPNNVNTGTHNTLVVQGTCSLAFNNTAFYDASPAAGVAYIQMLGQLTGAYTTLFNPGVTGATIDSVITTPFISVISALRGVKFSTGFSSTDPNTLDAYNENNATTVGVTVGGVALASANFTLNWNHTKIGREVLTRGHLNIASLAGNTGPIVITNLPYPASSEQVYAGSVDFHHYGAVALGSGNILVGSVVGGTSTMTLNLKEAAGTVAATHTQIPAGADLYFAGRYTAAQ